MYTYSFFKPQPSLELPLGIKGKLEIVCTEKIAALVESSLSLEEIQKDEESILKAVLSHDRVICEIFTKTTILPLRFGTYFKTKDALINHLKENTKAYEEKLLFLTDKAEYKLGIKPQPYDPLISESEPASGRDFFLLKKRRYQAQQEYQQQREKQWDNLIQHLQKDYILFLGNPSGEEQQCYILAPRNHGEINSQELQKWQEMTPHWELTLSLPLPPYHFV